MSSLFIRCVAIAIVLTFTAACGKKNIDSVKKSVEEGLSDPQSAQYKDVKEFPEGVVCGQVNAKNKLGGYAGFQAFVYRDGREVNLKDYPFADSILCNETPKKALAFATQVMDLAKADLNDAKVALEKAEKEANHWIAQCKAQKEPAGKEVFCGHAMKYKAPFEEAMVKMVQAESVYKRRAEEVASLK